MTNKVTAATVKAIGVVRNELNEPRRGPDVMQMVSEIVMDESLTDALDHLDEFSNIFVIYLTGPGPQEPKALRIYPHDDENNPLAGIFSTFTTDRPNPIGMNLAKIVERNGNILKVTNFGVVNGTSVIDIRPYIPMHFSVPDAKVGSWL